MFFKGRQSATSCRIIHNACTWYRPCSPVSRIRQNKQRLRARRRQQQQKLAVSSGAHPSFVVIVAAGIGSCLGRQLAGLPRPGLLVRPLRRRSTDHQRQHHPQFDRATTAATLAAAGGAHAARVPPHQLNAAGAARGPAA